MLEKIKYFFKSGKDRVVIAVCFLMSLLFWFLIKFSNEYTYYIDYPIEFINHPIDKYLKEEPSKTLKVKVRGFGFNFLKENFKNRKLQLDALKLPKQTSKLSFFILTQNKKPEISKALSGFVVLDISPDTLNLNYSEKTKKDIEVKVPNSITCRDNYIQTEPLQVSPKNIEIFGPSHILDTLSYISTDVLIREDVFDDIHEKLPILFSNELLSSRVLEVEVRQDVARFTEINLVIPIQFINVPKGERLIIKPSEVDLSYWVAMEDVGKVVEKDFLIYCDYNEVSITKKSVLNVFLNDDLKPSIVRRVKYHPSTVEFINKK